MSSVEVWGVGGAQHSRLAACDKPQERAEGS